MGDTWYISGESVYDDPNFYVAVYVDTGGFPKAQYGNRPIETYGQAKPQGRHHKHRIYPQ